MNQELPSLSVCVNQLNILELFKPISLYMQNNLADNYRCSSPSCVVKSLNFSVHPVSHKSSSNLTYRSCFPTNLFKSVKYYLKIIEGSLLYIQAKASADDHIYALFHFPEFMSCDFLVKTSEK